MIWPAKRSRGIGLQPQRAVEQLRRIEEGVAVEAAEARELGVAQAGDHAEDVGLDGVAQLGLEADHVVERAELVVLAQLHDGVGLLVRLVRIGEPDRLHRPVAQRLAAALGHHLDRQAAVEIGDLLPVVMLVRLAGEERVDEGVVLRLVHRAVDVVGAGAAGAGLVVARLEPGDVHVDRVEMDDRRDGIEEGERVLAGEGADRLGERRRGEGAGRDDDAVPVRRQAGDLAALDGDQRVRCERLADRGRKSVAVDRQRAAGRHLVASAARMISEPARRSSSCRRPTALVSRSSERKELEQTSSASRSVWCAPRSSGPAASRGGRRERRGARSATRPPSRRGRRR